MTNITDEQCKVFNRASVEYRNLEGMLTSQINEVKAGLEAYEQSKWIKFDKGDERTWPGNMERVFVRDEDIGCLSARHSSAGWYLEGELDKSDKVTHWQPLPTFKE